MPYTAKYFKAFELVPRKLYEARGERAIELLDKELLIALDYVRDNLGKVTVNNWKYGGNLQYRGIRTAGSADYSPTSQHSYGKAADLNVEGMTADQVNQWIIANRNDPQLKAITFIEMGQSWTHIDTRPEQNFSLVCWWVDGKTEVLTRT